MGAVVTDASQDFEDRFNKVDVKHWLGQFYVTKVTGTIEDASTVGGAFQASVHGAHTGVTEATKLGSAFVIGLRGVYFSYRVSSNEIWV